MNIINNISTWGLGAINGYKGVSPDIKYGGLALSAAINTMVIFARAPRQHTALSIPAGLLVTGATFWLGDLIGRASRPPTFPPEQMLWPNLAKKN
jgi:hypothetical protein